MSEPTKELTLTRTFDAPRDLVFKAWTDPELLSQWWGPNGVTIPVCEVDAVVGGKLNIVMLAGEELGPMAGAKWPMTGVYREITPPEKIVYDASPEVEGQPIMDTVNTLTFEEENGKTKLTLHIVHGRSRLYNYFSQIITEWLG
jgi:uncharacterized protein YndB with AHSA1/START domain